MKRCAFFIQAAQMLLWMQLWFMPGHTGHDGDNLLETATELVPCFAPVIVINGGNGESLKDSNHKAWPGKEVYLKQLAILGIPAKNIILSAPARHTREKTEVFANVIVEQGWKKVAVVNHGHCLLRAMLGWLSEIKKRKLSVKLYPVAPTSLNWMNKVHGQQGSAQKKRLNQCHSELERVLKYQKHYPEKFVSIETLVRYLVDLNKT